MMPLNTNYDLQFRLLDDATLLVEWPERIEVSILHEILNLEEALNEQSIAGLHESFHAYRSLALSFDPQVIDTNTLIQKVKAISLNDKKPAASKTWTLPVCYQPEYAVDMASVCDLLQCTIEDVIERHSSTAYTVYMMGFLPGFMYLGGLDPSLHIARKSSPEFNIPKGAVAIGGTQTGIYPMESPGGWYVIGNCPIPLFDPNSLPPCLIRAGDQIKFRAICPDEFKIIKIQLSTGIFNFNSLIHG
jgi:inhibitor of KinA